MNLLFADYEPDAHGAWLPDVDVRPATDADLPAAGALAAARQGEDAHTWTERFRRRAADPHQRLIVAELDNSIAGYGWVGWLTPAQDGGHTAPDGWYLAGIVVAPEYRRRGLGLRITQRRINWVWERADEIFYVVARGNRASRRLHESLGFREVTSEFQLPGVVFGDNDGLLCRLGRDDGYATVTSLDAYRAASARR